MRWTRLTSDSRPKTAALRVMLREDVMERLRFCKSVCGYPDLSSAVTEALERFFREEGV